MAAVPSISREGLGSPSRAGGSAPAAAFGPPRARRPQRDARRAARRASSWLDADGFCNPEKSPSRLPFTRGRASSPQVLIRVQMPVAMTLAMLFGLCSSRVCAPNAQVVAHPLRLLLVGCLSCVLSAAHACQIKETQPAARSLRHVSGWSSTLGSRPSRGLPLCCMAPRVALHVNCIRELLPVCRLQAAKMRRTQARPASVALRFWIWMIWIACQTNSRTSASPSRQALSLHWCVPAHTHL